VLFGKPEAVSAEVHREKDGPGVNDAIEIRLRYPDLLVTLGANSLSLPAAPRFHLRGTQGGYVKNGVDPQEAALTKITRIDDPNWGQETTANWGVLHVGIDGGTVSRPVPALAGDYRAYYAGIRDALLGKSAPPVTGVDGWRVARLLEWAQESSDRRCEIACDWSGEPQ
jgi:scyllo-inositol 2-dehydrogenase (NADP+)